MDHEFMEEVVEVGKDNAVLKMGDRAVVPFTNFRGNCDQCKTGSFSVCERTNQNKEKADKVFGHTTAGVLGYSTSITSRILRRARVQKKCIDAMGIESHATRSFDAMYDSVKQAAMLETDRPHVLRQMMYVCRPAGILSVSGVYGGLIHKSPRSAPR